MSLRKGKLPVRDNRWYGRRVDVPDQRDHLFAFTHPEVVAKPLPPRVDLRETGFLSPIYDQGQLGSCVGNGTAAALAFDERKEGRFPATPRGSQPIAAEPSRLFLYYNARVIEGSVASDSGCEIRDGIKAAAKLGAPREKYWPYTIRKFANKPTKTAFTDGSKHQAIKYSRCSAHNLMAALAGGFPVVIGISVYESFENAAVAKTGVVPMPQQDEEMLGGHCMLCVGYEIDPDNNPHTRFIVRNSWGTNWGDAGHCYIPTEYLIDPDLAGDFWVISSTE